MKSREWQKTRPINRQRSMPTESGLLLHSLVCAINCMWEGWCMHHLRSFVCPQMFISHTHWRTHMLTNGLWPYSHFFPFVLFCTGYIGHYFWTHAHWLTHSFWMWPLHYLSHSRTSFAFWLHKFNIRSCSCQVMLLAEVWRFQMNSYHDKTVVTSWYIIKNRTHFSPALTKLHHDKISDIPRFLIYVYIYNHRATFTRMNLCVMGDMEVVEQCAVELWQAVSYWSTDVLQRPATTHTHTSVRKLSNSVFLEVLLACPLSPCTH